VLNRTALHPCQKMPDQQLTDSRRCFLFLARNCASMKLQQTPLTQNFLRFAVSAVLPCWSPRTPCHGSFTAAEPRSLPRLRRLLSSGSTSPARASRGSAAPVSARQPAAAKDTTAVLRLVAVTRPRRKPPRLTSLPATACRPATLAPPARQTSRRRAARRSDRLPNPSRGNATAGAALRVW